MTRRLFFAGMIVLGNGFGLDMNDTAAPEFKVTIGPAAFASSAGDDVLDRYLEAHNRRVRLTGLPDHLNPLVLDAAKVRAFLRGLHELPVSTRQALNGQTIDLTDPALGLHLSDPVSAETLNRGFDLEIRRTGRSEREVRLKGSRDSQLAEKLSQDAERATSQFHREVQELESSERQRSNTPAEKSASLGELSLARWKRSAAARVWRTNAEELAALHPREMAIAKKAREAKSAQLKFLQPSWVGLPDR